VVALVAGGVVVSAAMRHSAGISETLGRAAVGLVPGTLVAGVVLAGSVVLSVRLLGLGLREGIYPVRSRIGWQVWSIERILDLSRVVLFPLYSSLFTPVWLRLLGAKVGRDVEASTLLLIPSLTVIRDGAFLADDTLIGSYELGGGWMRIAPIEIGKRAFLDAMESSLPAGLAAMQAQLSLLNSTEDASEGIGAFLQKRTPEWKGR